MGALRDVFCRFGDLIDVYMLANRNCGYAKYASRKSAEEAIKVSNCIFCGFSYCIVFFFFRRYMVVKFMG